MPSTSSDRSRRIRSYLLQIQKQSNITYYYILQYYILLFSGSVSRAIYLELVPNLTTQEFIKSMKRVIARLGSPKIYSDNAKTLQAGAKWLTRINNDDKFHNFLSNEKITWKFSLSEAPRWCGQFDRNEQQSQ